MVLGLVATGQTAAKKSSAPASTPVKKMAGAIMPTWPAMEAKIRETWAERYPRETIVSVTKVGEPSYADEPGSSTTSTMTSGSFDWGDWSWNESNFTTTIKGREGSYLRQKVDVLVERANKSKATFHVAALYKLAGKAWEFAEMPVGKVDEMAAAGDPTQPSDAEAGKIFAAAYRKTRPDFDVAAIKVLSKEFHRYKERMWITYKLQIQASGTAKHTKGAGSKWICTPPEYDSQLKWDATRKEWMPDESAITNMNESSQCEQQ
jgi:hypothetical protein